MGAFVCPSMGERTEVALADYGDFAGKHDAQHYQYDSYPPVAA